MVKIEVKINGVNTLVDVSKLDKLDNGLFADNYNEDFTVDVDKENEEIDFRRVQAIKSKASELISSKYPDYKQLNIIRIGGAELEAMSAYIDSIRKISNKAEQDGIKVEDIQWL